MSDHWRTTSPPALTAIILAGGKSTRFGSDKASALLGGRPLLEWMVEAVSPVCGEVVVVRAEGQVLPTLTSDRDVTIAVDLVPERGPVAGLLSGLAHVSAPYVFATSCDAPLLRPALIDLLRVAAEGHDVAVPEVEGHPQPLVAVYRAAALRPALERSLASPRASLRDALALLDAVMVEDQPLRQADPNLDSFRNANRPEILARIEAELAAGAARFPLRNRESRFDNRAK